MRILYAIQGTGNGHIGRAMAIAPYLKQEAEVDFLISGLSMELDFPYDYKYRYHGLSFFFGNNGGINYIKSLTHFRPIRLIIDILSCPIENYDVVVNDFEPISAWAAKRKGIPVVAVSHQAAFYSDKVPLPKNRNKLMEWGMKRLFAPADDYVGLHYKPYDEQVLAPIIRDTIANAEVTDEGHITVYLPSFADESLVQIFSNFSDYQWHVFSKKTNKELIKGNVQLSPVNKEEYERSLTSCHGLITGGGFQSTSEALFLGKKLLVIPMYDQYEQLCNAAALEEIGETVIPNLKSNSLPKIAAWLASEKRERLAYKSETKNVAQEIIKVASSLSSLS